MDALATTRRKALPISPCFVPGDEGAAGFTALAARGAEVGIATNSVAVNDVPAVHSGHARYRDRLLAQSMHLYELKARGHTGHVPRAGLAADRIAVAAAEGGSAFRMCPLSPVSSSGSRFRRQAQHGCHVDG